MKEPYFSIILPTYNRCYVLWRAIQSVIAQTYPFWELIIIDDSSGDNTALLVKQFSDPRIKYYKLKKNGGPAAARNYGLKKSRHELIAYIDSDNEWHKDYLEVVKNTFEKYPDKVLTFCKKNYRLNLINSKKGGKVNLRDEWTNHRKYFDLKRLWQRKIIIDVNTMAHRRSILKRTGGWDNKLDFWEDFEFTLRVSKFFPEKIIYINRTMVDYEQTLDLSTKDKIFKRWQNAEKAIYQKHKNCVLMEEQNWYPPSVAYKSTENVIKFLTSKKKAE